MKEGTTFSLTVSRVYEMLFSGDAISVTVPGTNGEITVLAHHEPYISKLKKGTITVRTRDSKTEYPIERGLLEVSNGEVTILV